MMQRGEEFGPGKFDDLIEGNGAPHQRYTTRDYTAYLNNSRRRRSVVLDLESDRMRTSPSPSRLEQERGIVMEERRLRTGRPA